MSIVFLKNSKKIKTREEISTKSRENFPSG